MKSHGKKQVAKGGSSKSTMDSKDKEMDIKKIMKDIEYLGAAHMTWKERKELENRKVVSLGGKPPKKQRLPLSVARVPMKKQKEREEKSLLEASILGRFGGKSRGSFKGREERQKPEDRVLKSSEGRFRNGVLDVKQLLRSTPHAREGQSQSQSQSQSCEAKKGKKQKGKEKKNRGKKGGGRKRH